MSDMQVSEVVQEEKKEAKLTVAFGVKKAIEAGITATADIVGYCEGLGLKTNKAYVSSLKWHLKKSARSATTSVVKSNGHAGSANEHQALEFALKAGGIKNALEKLDGLKQQDGYRFAESVNGVDKAKRLLKLIAEKLTA